MPNELYDKWVEESKSEIAQVEKEMKVREFVEGSSPVTTKFSVDKVGAISAQVYGEGRYVSAELCHNEDTSQCPGAYILNFSYPDISKVQSAYASLNGIPTEEVKTDDPDFITWMEETSVDSAKWWEQTHASWTHSSSFKAGITYESKHDALTALATGEIFSTMKFDNLRGVMPIATESGVQSEDNSQ